MIRRRQQLRDVFQTANEMRRLTLTYWEDLGRWLDEPFLNYFNYVCALPYFEDPPDCETVSRPLYTLRPNYHPRDCDDKSVLIASWLHGHDIKSKFIAVSTQENRELNHVFVQDENGIYLDATYPEYRGIIGKYPYFNEVTYKEDLTDLF